MKISEIFYSIQGEGKLIGTPFIFIRTAGCNLSCQYCDTKYAKVGQEWQLVDIVVEVTKFPCKHIVITGGEPLLQSATLDLCHMLSSMNYHVTIETNGTLSIPMPDVIGIDLLSISPKLSNSGVDKNKRYKVDIVKELISYGIDYYLKFVVENEADVLEMETEWLDKLNILPQHVYLMPQAIISKDAIAKGRELVEACKEKRYKLSPRLHTIYWGNKRGI